MALCLCRDLPDEELTCVTAQSILYVLSRLSTSSTNWETPLCFTLLFRFLYWSPYTKATTFLALVKAT